jgi:hypothetical protein
MRKYINRIVLIGAFAGMLLAACNKTVEDTDVYVDSYIQSIFNKNSVPVYRVMHTAYSYTKLLSVSVTGSGGKTIPLTNYANNGYSFYLPLANAQDSATFTTAVPAPESFTYNVSYEGGTTATKTNATVDKSLLPAQQLTATKTATDIVLSWKPVTNVEAYKVRIFSEDLSTKVNTLIYESDYLVPVNATSDLTIPFSLVSFSQFLSTNLSFEVSSFIFESKQETYHAVSAATVKKYFGI